MTTHTMMIPMPVVVLLGVITTAALWTSITQPTRETTGLDHGAGYGGDGHDDGHGAPGASPPGGPPPGAS